MQGRPIRRTVALAYKAGSFLVALLFVFLGVFVLCADRAAAATAPGTVILNTSSASYEDANSDALTAISNTFSTTVQNAPIVTVTAPDPQSVTPAMVAVDTFILTNTGNAAGTFALPSDAIFRGTATGTTLIGYVLASGSCSPANPCNITALNAELAALPPFAAAGGATTVGVVYSVSATATMGSTIQAVPAATVSYAAAANGAVAETSAVTTAASPPTDTLIVDARLDVQATASPSGSNITWTVTANNGGASTAQGLQSAKAALGATNTGIPIFIPVPVFSGAPLVIQSVSEPTIAGQSSGAVVTAYYNASTCSGAAPSGWGATYSTAKCIAVYASNTTAAVLPSMIGGSSGAGAVTTPQITFSFTTNQPGGMGSATLVASSAIGGASWATGAVPILGQGLTMGTTDAATALLNAIESNVTPSSGILAPGGASNQAAAGSSTPSPSPSSSPGGYSLVNGPYGAAGATGLYPGASGTASNMLDFTALNVPCTSNGNAGVNGSSCAVGPATIVNEVKNTGNSSDNITITTTPPSGFTVALYIVTGCSSAGSGVPVCTQGAQLMPGTATPVPANTAFDYEAVYTASGNVTPFTPYVTKLTATGTGDTNDTYNVLYPGGVVQVTNAVAVTSTGCPAGQSVPASGVCPSGTLSYTVAYQNVVLPLNVGTEPAFAVNPCYTMAGTLSISDDGTGPVGPESTNNWATFTNGLAAAATDTTGGTVFVYSSPTTTIPTYSGATKLTAQIGGSTYQLVPGAGGTITFTAVVK